MAADDTILPGGRTLSSLGSPLSDLIDEALFLYTEWREEAAAVEEIYHRWSIAPVAEREEWYGAYIAALDQEESAAMMLGITASELRASL
jgi:hypothetical protein